MPPKRKGTHPKRNDVWVEKRNHASQCSENNLNNYIKWLLKYYPKKHRALNLITLASQNPEPRERPFNPEERSEEHFTLKEGKNRVLRRYKQDYFRHLAIDTDSSKVYLNKPMQNARTLLITQKNDNIEIQDRYLKKALRNNKNLKSLVIMGYYHSSSSKLLIDGLKYSSSIRTFVIKNLPYLSPKQWKTFLADCHPSLENLAIEGVIASQYFENKMEPLMQLIEIVFEMKYLKNLHFGVEAFSHWDFDVTRIPFQKLRENKVNHDIRVFHTAGTLDISKLDAVTLKNIDFLSFKNDNITLCKETIKHHLLCQDQTKNRLLLNLPASLQCDISSLICACSNISVLDLSLSDAAHLIPNAACLQRLHNLRHLFIFIRESTKHYGKFFDNLGKGLQGNTVLSSITLEIRDLDVFENIDTSKAFFGACAATVTKFSVKLASFSEPTEIIQSFYDSARQMKNLRDLYLQTVTPGSRINAYDFHITNLAKLIKENEALEELSIKFPFYSDQAIFDFEVFQNLKRLRKLTIDFGKALITTKQFQELQNLSNLIHIEFYMIGSLGLSDKESWEFFKILKRNRELQVIKINCRGFYFFNAEGVEEENVESLELHSEKLLNEHGNLKTVILKCEQSSAVIIFQEKCRWSQVEDILAEDPLYNPEIICKKIVC